MTATLLTVSFGLMPVVSANANSLAVVPDRVTTPRVEIPGLEIPGEHPGSALDTKPSTLKPFGVMWIARLGVKMSIYTGVTDKVFKKGFGYWPGTGLPGEIGNMVIGGHRTTGPRPFYNIQNMKIGDPIVINYKGKRYTYKVNKTLIIKPTDTWILTQNVTKPMLTMFACHPRGTYKQRFVVTAVLSK